MNGALYAIDSTAFRAINGGSANALFDLIMPAITDVRNAYIPYAILFILLLWKGGSRGRWCALLMAVTVLITDPVNSRIIKEMVMRVRPCEALAGVRLLVPCGGGKSFPSSHAVNNFAAAVIISYFFRRAAPYAFGVASVIAFSRVYVGVHYPGDVIGGALVGSVMAAIVLLIWKLIIDRWRRHRGGV
ncbi:MAG: Membrane-associated phospholipid phosphatase [Chlorobi bacterium]|nr:Membrane-associated phospholipid phosphatase [Chlorobiota bacterium]